MCEERCFDGASSFKTDLVHQQAKCTASSDCKWQLGFVRAGQSGLGWPVTAVYGHDPMPAITAEQVAQKTRTISKAG